MYKVLKALPVVILALVGTFPALGQDTSVVDFWGTKLKPNQERARGIKYLLPDPPSNSIERIRYWNAIAINASGLDHTPVAPGENRVFGQQLGPGRAARAMAIVHISMFEAVNACRGNYTSYIGMAPASVPTDVDAAIAKSVAVALSYVYPSQSPLFAQLLEDDLARIPDGESKKQGVKLGTATATRSMIMRKGDGSNRGEPLVGSGFINSLLPGHWRQDPISMVPIALGANWGEVTPFVLTSGSQFRSAPPPLMTSEQYTVAFDESKRLGGDGITTPTERTALQTYIGTFWAYDGTPSLCAPPRLYNQITQQITLERRSTLVETARLFALVNIAMADASIAGWDSKFHYDYWRSITAIREADPGTGPTLLGDGNPLTIGDVNFVPLGAPASGLVGPNFTPPFPTYPSGHATFGGALFETLRRFYGTDNIQFTIVSDEYNGITVDNHGNVRPLIPRTFNSFSQAEEENGQSRIYLGIHFAFDKTAGIVQGRQVAGYVYDNVYLHHRDQ